MSATCSKQLLLRDQEYSWVGELARQPDRGMSIGTASSPSCDDGNGPAQSAPQKVFSVLGLKPSIALIDEQGSVYVSDPTAMNSAIAELQEPVLCGSDRTFEMSGFVLGTPGATSAQEGPLKPPYSATMMVDRGDLSALAKYSQIQIDVRVTAETRRGDDRELIDASLEGARLNVVSACAKGNFLAVALER